MTPAARVAAAIDVLDRWEAGEDRAEPLLRRWGRANRFAGSGDRRALADIVYECLRRRRSLAWLSGAVGGRAMTHGLALASGWPVGAIFSGEGHAPAALSAEELEGRAPDDAPDPVRFDHPDWLEAPLKAALGPRYAASMAALGVRAPVDLRANRLKGGRVAALEALAGAGIAAAPLEAPDAIRCPPGARIAASRAFSEGLVEPQDEASQAGAAFAAPRPGETVLDFCAGGGGKSLAFASLMGGEGRIVAHDSAPGRMRDLPARAARAGASIEIAPDLAALDGLRSRVDLVFVDAPCSGSGAWRRDPEAKWRLTPQILATRLDEQRAAFKGALAYLAPGGRIVYATCALLAEENGAQARWMAAEHGLKLDAELSRAPDEGADGFYAARLIR
ncbi:MAG: RsmB/NOP family class I SAM-dependent RNA methyltransferase [Paracoccaceae bacterium]